MWKLSHLEYIYIFLHRTDPGMNFTVSQENIKEREYLYWLSFSSFPCVDIHRPNHIASANLAWVFYNTDWYGIERRNSCFPGCSVTPVTSKGLSFFWYMWGQKVTSTELIRLKINGKTGVFIGVSYVWCKTRFLEAKNSSEVVF